jgi:hypothetical protein
MRGSEHINGNELDELLKEFSLDKNAMTTNETEADFVLSQDYAVKIDPEKEKQLLARLKGPGGNMKWFFLSGLVLLISGSVCLYLYRTIYDNKREEIKEITVAVQEGLVKEKGTTGRKKENAENVIKIKDTFGRPKIIFPVINDTFKVKQPEAQKIKEESNGKTVPFISEAEILKYKKIKDQMLSRLVRGDKNLYSHIPSAKIKYAGKDVIIDGFVLRNVGITNLEYKVFLADLLAQKRNDEYLIADVRNEGWSSSGYKDLATTYFVSETYNDFPVVNVTYDGATLFCKWLQQEVDLYVKRNKLKLKDLIILMPNDEEWIYAAREGYAKIAFEKGYNTIYDQAEGLVDKNFTKRAELVKRRVMRADTMYAIYTTNHYGWAENEIKDFFGKGSEYYMNVTADTIYPERMKVMGKIGRVSEMTGVRSGSKIWLSGLSWRHKDDYEKLEMEFKTKLYSPFVGFRVAVIDPNDPEYKNPFW